MIIQSLNKKITQLSLGSMQLFMSSYIKPIRHSSFEPMNNQFHSVFANKYLSDIPCNSRIPMPFIYWRYNYICKLDTNKSFGPSIVLKHYAAQVSSTLRTQSISTGTVHGNILRRMISSDPSNYHPISLTSICCKVIWSYYSVMKHLQKHQVLQFQGNWGSANISSRRYLGPAKNRSIWTSVWYHSTLPLTTQITFKGKTHSWVKSW